jgi:hypothetical protein
LHLADLKNNRQHLGMIKNSLLFGSLAALLACPSSRGQNPASPTPPKSAKPEASSKKSSLIVKLDDCPPPVQQSFRKNENFARLAQIKRIERSGTVLYAFETGSEKGRDEETTYFYSEAGELKRSEADIPLAKAPEAVRNALNKLAETGFTVDDVEVVTESARITYKAELESNGAKDRKVLISESGEILENKPEEND